MHLLKRDGTSGGEQATFSLEQKKQKTIAELTTGTGFLQDIPQIISSAMNWNVIYDPVKDRIAAPVARTWCTANGHSFGSYVYSSNGIRSYLS